MNWENNMNENEQRPLFDEPARARRTDPETSHAAARSFDLYTLRNSQRAVLAVFERFPPGMTDSDLLIEYRRYRDTPGVHISDVHMPRQSASGLRTRRHELVTVGLLVDSGRRERLHGGRRSIVWRVKL